MQAVEKSLQALLQSLPRSPDKDTLDRVVSGTLRQQTAAESSSAAEVRKNQWEVVLKNDVFALAASEGTALKADSARYYDAIKGRLDIILTFTEHGACDANFPVNVLHDLLETQTIPSCSQIFSWIELRTDRLTMGMVPQKGKALILLRSLNELLRRLSKMGNSTMFCGRILTFLSRVFPLGERSGVNLRGEYGPAWDGPGTKLWEGAKRTVVVPAKKPAEGEEEQMQVDEVKSENDSSDGDVMKRGDLYNVFWSLQVPFSRPSMFMEGVSLARLKEAINKVLPVIKEATAKERALMGSKSSAGGTSLKRQREPEAIEDVAGRDYFFAKYLTSPELLELEIADTHFRRQFLFQLLILLSHLLTYTKEYKAAWPAPRNRTMVIEWTLDGANAQWVQETVTKASEELRQTTPNGRSFAEMIHVILEREKNWVNWKNQLCQPFDKEPWAEEEITVKDDEVEDGQKEENGHGDDSEERVDEEEAVNVEKRGEVAGEADAKEEKADVDGGDATKEKKEKETSTDSIPKKVGLEEATRGIRQHMRKDKKPWPHKLGSQPLTAVWELGYRDLSDLEYCGQPGDVQGFEKRMKQEDARIEMRKRDLKRKQQLVRPATSVPAPAPASMSTPSPAPASARLPSSTSAPLHPSLPAKPGTTPPASQSLDPIAPKAALSEASAPKAAPADSPFTPRAAPARPVTPVGIAQDRIIAGLQENKHRWGWLALRAGRDQQAPQSALQDLIFVALGIEKPKEPEKNIREKETSDTHKAEQAATAKQASADVEMAGTGDVNAGAANAASMPRPPASIGSVENVPNGTGASSQSLKDVQMDER